MPGMPCIIPGSMPGIIPGIPGIPGTIPGIRPPAIPTFWGDAPGCIFIMLLGGRRRGVTAYLCTKPTVLTKYRATNAAWSRNGNNSYTSCDQTGKHSRHLIVVDTSKC